MRYVVACLGFYLIVALFGAYNPSMQVLHAASTDNRSNGSTKSAPTASDQSENESDRKITQQVRKAVTSDDSLSTSAQNVKIITQGGKVTLRGSVNNDGEKQKIADKAKKVSGVKNVENLITVEKK
jgi:hyperosmotically inducible periplasmic protein